MLLIICREFYDHCTIVGKAENNCGFFGAGTETNEFIRSTLVGSVQHFCVVVLLVSDHTSHTTYLTPGSSTSTQKTYDHFSVRYICNSKDIIV